MRNDTAASSAIARRFFLFFVVIMAPRLGAEVNLELRGMVSDLCSGDVVDIGLFAVSDNGEIQTIGGGQIILGWDALQLELLGKIDNGPYPWIASFFPNDSGGDGLNEPFTGPLPFVPANDGDALYSMFGQFAPNPPAEATPAGLLITTFRFQAVRPGDAALGVLAEFGSFTQTQLVDGLQPGLDVTGQLPTTLTSVSCPGPTLVGTNSRRVFATAPECPDLVALRVSGAPGQPAISCFSAYVQADGSLGPTPLFRPSADWGVAEIRDEYLGTSSWYIVESDCGTAELPGYGGAVAGLTWIWGDVNYSGHCDVSDILLVLAGFSNDFSGAPSEQLDILPCLPDGQVDLADILGVLDAFSGVPFLALCPPPCP
jgi:hypothetical protein